MLNIVGIWCLQFDLGVSTIIALLIVACLTKYLGKR